MGQTISHDDIRMARTFGPRRELLDFLLSIFEDDPEAELEVESLALELELEQDAVDQSTR